MKRLAKLCQQIAMRTVKLEFDRYRSRIVTMDGLCRACLATCARSWCQIVSDQFTFCTALTIPENDILPKTLCLKCFNLIDKFYCFKKQCIESEKTLRYSIIKDNDFPKDELDEIHIKKEIQYTNEETDDGVNADIGFDNHDSPHNNDDDDNKDSLFNDTQALVFENVSPKDIKNIRKIKTKRKKKLAPKAKCDKTLPKKKYIRKSRRIIKNFPCTMCHRRYVSAEKLDTHILKYHLDHKDFVCHICGGNYKSKYGMKVHLETHEYRERIHECTVCGKKYQSLTNLKSHMYRHRERRIFCEECNFPFATKGRLAKHMLTHQGVKPYKCDICNKVYARKSFLIIHRRTHSGEKPFDCDLCSMSFISRERMVEHRRRHTGEKPFKCVICNHSFSQCGTMTRHMKTHIKNLQ